MISERLCFAPEALRHGGASVTHCLAECRPPTFSHHFGQVATVEDCDGACRGGIQKTRTGRRNNPASLVPCAVTTGSGDGNCKHELRRSPHFALSDTLRRQKVRLGTGGAASRSLSSRRGSRGVCQEPSFVANVCRRYVEGAAGPEGFRNPSTRSLALGQPPWQFGSEAFFAQLGENRCALGQGKWRASRQCCSHETPPATCPSIRPFLATAEAGS